MIYELVLQNFDCSLEFVFSLLLLQPFNFSPVSFACNFLNWGCVILREIEFLLKICWSIPCLHPSWKVHALLSHNGDVFACSINIWWQMVLDASENNCLRRPIFEFFTCCSLCSDLHSLFSIWSSLVCLLISSSMFSTFHSKAVLADCRIE